MPTPPSADFLAAHSAVLTFLVAIVGLLGTILVLWWFIRPSRFSEEKNTTYECGENPQGPAWIQFNIRFYVFALIFIVFDVEAVFLLPWAVVFKQLGPLSQPFLEAYWNPGDWDPGSIAFMPRPWGVRLLDPISNAQGTGALQSGFCAFAEGGQ